MDITLEVGEVTKTVEVQPAHMIQSESTDVGTVIDSNRFLDLPLTLGGLTSLDSVRHENDLANCLHVSDCGNIR